jgi:hypothetical protein
MKMIYILKFKILQSLRKHTNPSPVDSLSNPMDNLALAGNAMNSFNVEPVMLPAGCFGLSARLVFFKVNMASPLTKTFTVGYLLQ